MGSDIIYNFASHFKNAIFIKNLPNFKPRKYSLENFTDKIPAQNYLKIINEIIQI